MSPSGSNCRNNLDLLHLILHHESLRVSIAFLRIELATQERIAGTNGRHFGYGIVHSIMNADSQVQHTAISKLRCVGVLCEGSISGKSDVLR